MKFIIFSFIVLSVYWLVRILVSFFWIKHERRTFKRGYRTPTRQFIIVIPILEEKEIIFSTIEYFLAWLRPFPGSKLVIVTSGKEEKICKEKKESARQRVVNGARGEIISLIKTDFGEDLSDLENIEILKQRARAAIDNYQTTIDVLKNFHRQEAIIIHNPFTSGRMAHDLNYGLKTLIERGLWHDELVGIYNADSRPDPETLFWLSERSRGSGLVFQQYGNYFGNLGSIFKKQFIGRAILFSSSVWQNRWSLGFEIFNNLKQFLFSGQTIFGERFFYPLNYCIGHGLFFTKDIFERQNFFEDTQSEDAVFGLELSYEKIRITPMPFFDLADSPNFLESLFFQKAAWFFGPFHAPRYYKKLKSKVPSADRARLFILSAKLFFHAFFWLAGPTCLLVLLAGAVITRDFILLLLVYLSFLVLPGLLVYGLFPNKKIKAGQALIFLLIGSGLAYIMHGASAYYAIFQTVKAGLTRQGLAKYKTKIQRS